MDNYSFDITEEKINSMPVEHYEALERIRDGRGRLYQLRPMICAFMLDENGIPIPYELALQITSKFTAAEISSLVLKFFEVMKEKAVPNTNGSP